MEARVTAKIKISITPEVITTVKSYIKGLQYCVDTAWDAGIKNNVKLHPFVYKHLRETLPAQLAISCIKKTCGIVKKAKTKPLIKKASVGYNFPRSANIKGDKLVLRLLNCRQTFNIKIPECYKQYFSWNIKESLLRIDNRGRAYFLFTFSKEVEAINSCFQNRVLGIDLGINNLAVTSDGRFYNSSSIKQAKRRFKYLRSKLQAIGTRSSKRLLKKISGRETRYMTWINHNISKNIVTTFDGGKIIMEDLKGIRKKHRGRVMNYWISNWSYSQLQNFITYKAERLGIIVEKVKPFMTSQLCHRCGQIGVRNHGRFDCYICGVFHYNSDLNASRNLAHPKLVERQAVVTQPHIQANEHKGIPTNATACEAMNKSHAL